MSRKTRLIIATKNKNKFKEIKKLLEDLNLKITYLGKILPSLSIKEDGKSFYENALKKAKAVSSLFPEDLVVGEDSGLVVKCLGDKPGIYSKRYAGKDASDLDNNLKLLRVLKKKKDRRAYFICTVVLVKGKRLLRKFEGKLWGKIYDKLEGNFGFGYDPIFYLPRFRKTVAQLSLEEKNKISHRAKAFLKLKKFLAKYLKCK